MSRETQAVSVTGHDGQEFRYTEGRSFAMEGPRHVRIFNESGKALAIHSEFSNVRLVREDASLALTDPAFPTQERTIALNDAISQAMAGCRVGWFAETFSALSKDFEDARAVLPPGSLKISYTHGNQYIETPAGGTLDFLSVKRSRGMTLNYAHVPASLPVRELESIIPSVTPGGGIVLYYK